MNNTCDVWLFAADRCCSRKPKVTVILKKAVHVNVLDAGGTYSPGNWDLCTQHANMLQAAMKEQHK